MFEVPCNHPCHSYMICDPVLYHPESIQLKIHCLSPPDVPSHHMADHLHVCRQVVASFTKDVATIGMP